MTSTGSNGRRWSATATSPATGRSACPARSRDLRSAPSGSAACRGASWSRRRSRLAERGHGGRLVRVAVDRGRAAGAGAFAASRAIFLPDGRAPVTRERGAEQRLHNPALARTLRRLAEAGPRDFYEGEIARTIVADLAAGGCVDRCRRSRRPIRPRWSRRATLDYRGTQAARDAGPERRPDLSRGAAALAGDAAAGARARRRTRRSPMRARSATPMQTRLETYGHAGATNDPGCTSHVSVIDADGNMVALTNTLLSRFGAKVTLPATGILMNNGMMWFDPRPGRPNAIAAGAAAARQHVPADRDARRQAGVRDRRGRRPADLAGAGAARSRSCSTSACRLEEAFHVPRLDASTPHHPVQRPHAGRSGGGDSRRLSRSSSSRTRSIRCSSPCRTPCSTTCVAAAIIGMAHVDDALACGTPPRSPRMSG